MKLSDQMSSSPSTSSGSPDSVELAVESTENRCQVCRQKAHGLHFGAITCRACAAFFRRVAAGASFPIKCRKGKGNCEILPNGRSCCKKCRLKKCEEIGMDIRNFQFDRDPISTSKKQFPLSLANFLGRPQFIILCDPETASSSKNRQTVDLSELLEKAAKILRTMKSPLNKGQNRLKKLAMTLNLDKEQDEVEFRKITKVGLKETLSFWEYDFLAIATWFSMFDEFMELDIEVKMKFLKCTWHVWNRLEKLARTAEKQNQKKIDKKSVVLAENVELNMEELELDLGWLTNFSLEQISYYIEGFGDMSMFEVIPLIMDFEPSTVELSYMMAQLCFQHAGKQLGGKYAEISERFQEILASDLHVYYTRELRMTRYSDRMLKMMKINNMIKRILWQRQEKIAIARLFDIFHVKFSDPEMFDQLY